MTVTYTSEVTTCKGVGGCFLKLLARWKGSIYKLIWSDLILYLVIYYVLNLTYQHVLDGKTKTYFEDVVNYFGKYGSLIPISFVLGFYVDIIVGRWWNQYSSIPFPDNLAILVGASIKGQDRKSRALKRTLVRYACATFTITLTMISPKVKKRFPTLDHFIEAGLLTKEEKQIMEELENEFPRYSKYWLPVSWASNLVVSAREQGFIRESEYVEKILEELNNFRSKCGSLLDYDWISVPLVYTQVVTIAVYSYFLISVVGNQNIENKDKNIIGSYFPLLPVLEFLFYMGWLKVAETLINPYGNDDDDFEVTWMVDRHLQVVYLLVDKIPQKMPKLLKDLHWNETAPVALPYTKASENYMKEYPKASTNKLVVSNVDQEIVMPHVIIKENQENAYRSGPPLVARGMNMLRSASHALRSVITGESTDSDEVDEGIIDNCNEETRELPYCEEFEQLRKQRADERKERHKSIYSSFKHSPKT